METRATAIKAGRRRHKWAMVQAMATVMYCKGSSFYNSIINEDGPRMLARIAAVIEYCQLAEDFFFLGNPYPAERYTLFFQNAPFPPKSNKTAPAAKPLSACHLLKEQICLQMFGQVCTLIEVLCLLCA
jgi:hypothetical protein